MADTLPNIILQPNIWIDLYAESGITVGMQMIIQNIGVCDVYLYSGIAQPSQGGNNMHYILQRGESSINDPGDVGAWAMCLSGGSISARVP